MIERNTLEEQADPQDSAAIELIMAENIALRVSTALTELLSFRGQMSASDEATDLHTAIVERVSHSLGWDTPYSAARHNIAQAIRDNGAIRDAVREVVQIELAANAATHTQHDMSNKC